MTETTLKTGLLEDYLTEDSPVYNQTFFILSYLLPKKNNDLEVPMIKVRGSFKSIEECEKKIEKLKVVDSYFNMYICEVGKWGGLFDEEDLKNSGKTDFKYREGILNDMVKEYQDSKDKADTEFERRKRILQKRAAWEGSKEGQEALATQRENPIAVKARVDHVESQLKELEKRTEELNEILSLSKNQLADYTEEELQKLEEEYKKVSNPNTASLTEIFDEEDDIFLKSLKRK